MLLQRELPVIVWGWAEPGEQVTVNLNRQTASITTGQDGQWRVSLQPLPAGGPYELTVAGKNTNTFVDVLVGDVWLCAGQSNMELLLRAADSAASAIPLATNTRIRFINETGPYEAEPLQDIVSTGWMVGNPQTAGSISAVGYFFAKRIINKTGIPIGLINCAWGGSVIEMWLAPAGVRLVPALDGMLREYELQLSNLNVEVVKYIDVSTHWLEKAREAQVSNEKIPLPPPAPGYPVGLIFSPIYNGRIAPLTPYRIKGVIWYQGESNVGQGENYYHKMRALITGWRAIWNQGSFPFYFVQLPNYQDSPDSLPDNPAGGDGWATLRMAQLKSLLIPHTGMAVAIDVGEAKNLHPRNKEDVGNRLALWALKNDYNQDDLVCSGPLYKGMTIEKNQVRITFDFIGRGLMVGKKQGHDLAREDVGGKLQKFSIAGADKRWVWADAVISGASVVVSSPVVPQPVAVRYAYSMNPAGCNLYNQEGLPASPFRTDSW